MAPAEAAGRVVGGRYELRSLLGQGGMGRVWLAHDAVLHRDVAVKEVTFSDSVTDAERRELCDRTLHEARAAARFEHPRVTTVHDVVEQDDRPWIVMEHVPSRSLAEVVGQDGALPVERAARIGLDVLAALGAAHAAGIVHRDVKPANVLVSDQGRAWLTDFGIATSTGQSRLTGQGVVLGSPSYIAPERARGDDPGAGVDVWGLGATLYFALEGRPPFDRGEGMATLLAVTTEPAPRPVSAGPLEPLLATLLDKDPARRPTIDQATATLRDVLDSGAVTRRLPTAAPPAAAPAPAPAPPGPPASPGPDRRPDAGDAAERIDLEQLAGLAAAAGKAVAGSAVRRMSRRSGRDDRPGPRVGPPPGPPVGPPPGRPVGPPPRAPHRPPARSRRFKRRWVVVPLVVLGVLLVLLVGLAGLALELLGVDD